MELTCAGWLLQIYFPTVYDIKYLMKFCDNLHGGLNKLAESLEVNRMGPQHQVRSHIMQRKEVPPCDCQPCAGSLLMWKGALASSALDCSAAVHTGWL